MSIGCLHDLDHMPPKKVLARFGACRCDAGSASDEVELASSGPSDQARLSRPNTAHAELEHGRRRSGSGDVRGRGTPAWVV